MKIDILYQEFRFLFQYDASFFGLKIESEEQRLGKNKDTAINHKYIEGGEYKRKIDQITNDKGINRLIYQLAKEMLNHRSGTNYEDMYWIDLDTREIVARETDGKVEHCVIYSEATKRKIKMPRRLLTIHSHPNSFPPSIDDFNSNYDYNYAYGVVVCPDGKIYLYSANERLNERYFLLNVAENKKNGYNEEEAQLLAIKDIQKTHDIFFKEVVDDGRA